jgi:hypothetical protein
MMRRREKVAPIIGTIGTDRVLMTGGGDGAEDYAAREMQAQMAPQKQKAQSQ